MTRGEALTELAAIKNRHLVEPSYDEERAHTDADTVLTELLRDLGCTDVVEAWRNIPKWYA